MAQDARRNPELRVSDAERDAVATELGQHFQDGRLDRGEFDQRVGSALQARTRGDLDALVTDLPRATAAEPAIRRGYSQRPRALAIVPLLVIAAFITATAHHGSTGGWPFAPFGLLWLIVPVLVIRARAAGRRRQWR